MVLHDHHRVHGQIHGGGGAAIVVVVVVVVVGVIRGSVPQWRVFGLVVLVLVLVSLLLVSLLLLVVLQVLLVSRNGKVHLDRR